METIKTGLEHLTDTTGVVRGKQEVKNFISMAHSKFDEVKLYKSEIDTNGEYLQYTLLTDNRISIYY